MIRTPDDLQSGPAGRRGVAGVRRTVALLTGLCLIVVVAACGEQGAALVGPTSRRRPRRANARRPATTSSPLSTTGSTARYLLHAPPGYDPNRPTALVIALHFYPGSGSAMRELAGLDAKADKDNVLVAYPDGQGGGFNALICCGKADDVGFLNALTDRIWCRPGTRTRTGSSSPASRTAAT